MNTTGKFNSTKTLQILAAFNNVERDWSDDNYRWGESQQQYVIDLCPVCGDTEHIRVDRRGQLESASGDCDADKIWDWLERHSVSRPTRKESTPGAPRKSSNGKPVPAEIERVAGTLVFDRRDGENYRFNCPVCKSHDNLSIRWLSDKNREVIKCWNGCHEDWPKLSKALRDVGCQLYWDDDTSFIYRGADGKPKYKETIYRKSDGTKSTPLNAFDGYDEAGRPKWKQGTGNMKGVERIPFQVPQLVKYPTEELWFHEGPKHAAISEENGLLSTAFAGGAKRTVKWYEKWNRYFEGREGIVLVPDWPSSVGIAYMLAIYEHLLPLGVPIRFVRARYGEDAWDHFHGGGTAEDFVPLTLDEVKDKRAELDADSHFVDVSDASSGVLALESAINSGWLPGVYQREGHLVRLRIGEEGTRVGPLKVEDLLGLSAKYLDIQKSGTDGTLHPCLPDDKLCKAALSGPSGPWKLPILRGVLDAPFVRADGSILQEPGYDRATRYYLDLRSSAPVVPYRPSRDELKIARSWLLKELLIDFPWRSDGDKANYISVLISTVLRDYIGALMPLFVMDASMAGSGKTLLADIAGVSYGYSSYAWVDKDDEIEKRITSILRRPGKPVIIWDNVGSRSALYQPSIAKLLTSRTWTGRILGVSEDVELVNDRVWIATGRNINLDGDIASRIVRVRLVPQPNPEKRSKFVIGDLSRWITDKSNADLLRYRLLLLARGWIAAGAPTVVKPMRQFSDWSSKVGGFLDYYAIPGFMSEEHADEDSPEEAREMEAFLARWYELGKGKPQPRTARELVENEHRFGETFPRWVLDRGNGAQRLGKLLRRSRDTWFAEYRVTSDKNRNGVQVWRVERHETPALPS